MSTDDTISDDDKAWMQEQQNKILSTTAKALAARQQIKALSVLVNAEPFFQFSNYDNRNGGQYYWSLRLAVPVEVYYGWLEDIDELETTIDDALRVVIRALSPNSFINCHIQTFVENDPDWRSKGRQFLSGEGITNQGRVRSDNIAARQYEGLLFRSRQEILFYQALKKEGVAFAPLAVVMRGGIEYRRVEPDFVIFKDGITMVVEIDGDLYHSETPAAAHSRLKFMLDEGAKLERILASACDTPEKAREAVALVLRTINKLRRAS
jgi:hypothetical protein